jgi:hypothetical protein
MFSGSTSFPFGYFNLGNVIPDLELGVSQTYTGRERNVQMLELHIEEDISQFDGMFNTRC